MCHTQPLSVSPLSYILKYEIGQYVKKWSDGVLDTLQDV